MTVAEKLQTIAENEQKVYEAGYDNGVKTEYDAFWDGYQQNGDRTDCRGMFAGVGWNADTIKPKYDINVFSGTYMFYGSGFVGSLKKHLADDLGVILDFSSATAFTGVFQYANQITETPHLDMSGISSQTTVSQIFHSCNNLVSAEITFSPLCAYNTCFNNCNNLENLIANGEIGGNGLNFQWSTKLTHDSLVSIVNALSTITSGLTVTLSKTAVNKAFETSGGAADGSTSEAWLTLRATRSNWTISLV